MRETEINPLTTEETISQYHYTIIIQWSQEAQCFVVSLPEWGNFSQTYGETYQDALKNAQEVLDLLVTSCLAEGKSLPPVKTFDQSHLLY